MGEKDEMRARLALTLEARGLLESGGELTIYGQPAWRGVEPGHDPQALMDASALQRQLVACAAGTEATGDGRCAAWVERAFSRLGWGVVAGDARELCRSYCGLTDTRALLVGMIVAVERHPFEPMGWDHGHVGIYVGDGQVRDCAGSRVRAVPLELWLSAYGVMEEPRWGWLGSIALG